MGEELKPCPVCRKQPKEVNDAGIAIYCCNVKTLHGIDRHSAVECWNYLVKRRKQNWKKRCVNE